MATLSGVPWYALLCMCCTVCEPAWAGAVLGDEVPPQFPVVDLHISEPAFTEYGRRAHMLFRNQIEGQLANLRRRTSDHGRRIGDMVGSLSRQLQQTTNALGWRLVAAAPA
eukprot:CAMPEP_0204520234 /NCGR_PEP_ID=MMETSP0661-20131031/5159_1 /ASSEMBLY_ACC=CAM_ASM_000606 /TAXON_ID=109239 /ORGANISM="Alexandrium margalefi, Strain AMGDE01CS-322" /LENGTH=110 /DNA_ID=CAMNT_0051525781 /DNA_START=68 /DNA_END=400 /DNA_ORIENTATION=-